MRIYTILPIRETETGHYVIDDPNQPAHKEILSTVPIYIIKTTSGGAVLEQYDKNGNHGWDVDFFNVDDAKHQAECEYEAPISWEEIPEEVEDTIAYVLDQMKK